MPFVILAYYAVTLGGPMRATIGMSMLDLVLVPTRGQSLDGWRILIHPIVFWITVWVAWPISLIVALVHAAPADGAGPRRRHADAAPRAASGRTILLHDLIELTAMCPSDHIALRACPA